VDHWRHGNAAFAGLLEEDRIIMHPMVLGELALGDLRSRADVLTDLAELRAGTLAEHAEVLELVERRRLWGRGIGWVDAHLLASALLDGSRLWTLDRQLRRVAQNLGTNWTG